MTRAIASLAALAFLLVACGPRTRTPAVTPVKATLAMPRATVQSTATPTPTATALQGRESQGPPSPSPTVTTAARPPSIPPLTTSEPEKAPKPCCGG